ncbi:MAG TPA: hypothetical protein VFF72_10120 [Caldimonas sp.]|nr:hypothetical protein [Caldimonas sp.]
MPLPILAKRIEEISMKTKIALSAIVAAVAVFSQGAFAQASSPTRAEVKAEAKTAAKAPAGEAGAGELKRPSTHSTKTRAQRKAETKAALKAHEGEAMGEAGSMKSQNTAGSTTTRAERKAKTKAALKAHEGTPMGQADSNAEPKK